MRARSTIYRPCRTGLIPDNGLQPTPRRERMRLQQMHASPREKTSPSGFLRVPSVTSWATHLPRRCSVTARRDTHQFISMFLGNLMRSPMTHAAHGLWSRHHRRTCGLPGIPPATQRYRAACVQNANDYHVAAQARSPSTSSSCSHD